MASKDKIVIAFDLYGTLLSTESIAKELATHFGQEKAKNIAGLWRRFAYLLL
jgi:2-haloacid dehalogenase